MSKNTTPMEAPKKPNAATEMASLMAVMKALDELDDAQRARVLRYARDFFNVYMGDS